MPTNAASTAAPAHTATRAAHPRSGAEHRKARTPNAAAAVAACPDGNAYPSAAASAPLSGGRGRATACFSASVRTPLPATVTPATSTGPRLRQMMPSTTPAATVTAPKTTGPPTVLAARITAVSAPVRCAATKLATGWSSAAMPSPSVTSSISVPAPTAADAMTTSPSAADAPKNHAGRSRTIKSCSHCIRRRSDARRPAASRSCRCTAVHRRTDAATTTRPPAAASSATTISVNSIGPVPRPRSDSRRRARTLHACAHGRRDCQLELETLVPAVLSGRRYGPSASCEAEPASFPASSHDRTHAPMAARLQPKPGVLVPRRGPTGTTADAFHRLCLSTARAFALNANVRG
jgi:hypothetical protein